LEREGDIVPFLPPPSKEKIMMHKKIWINHMLIHNKSGLDSKVFNELLDSLGVKELKILKRYDDLVARVVGICKMTKIDLLKTIRDDYRFDAQNCNNGDIWVDASDTAEDLTPEWITEGQLPHCGWYLTFNGEDNEFVPWARNILLQEVRINGWVRYMEHKLDAVAGKRNPFEIPATIPGMPWAGSGGNYL
jgi:hypothetical protein